MDKDQNGYGVICREEYTISWVMHGISPSFHTFRSPQSGTRPDHRWTRIKKGSAVSANEYRESFSGTAVRQSSPLGANGDGIAPVRPARGKRGRPCASPARWGQKRRHCAGQVRWGSKGTALRQSSPVRAKATALRRSGPLGAKAQRSTGPARPVHAGSHCIVPMARGYRSSFRHASPHRWRIRATKATRARPKDLL